MRKELCLSCSVGIAALLILSLSSPVQAKGTKGKSARKPAIAAGAGRVVELQRNETGWEGTWYWYVGNTYNATNLTGVTALGLLEAFRDAKDPGFLGAAVRAAGFIQAHLGIGATGTKYHVRCTAPDIVFLHLLGEVTGDASYSGRGDWEWLNIRSFREFASAGALHAFFGSIRRQMGAWDLAAFLEAAHLSGDQEWADDAAAILSDTADSYYGAENPYRALNLAGAIRAMVGCGYYEQYPEQILHLLKEMLLLSDQENGVGGSVQDTAYAVMALNTVGGAARAHANALARWLARKQEHSGGWTDGGYEYPETDGEAVRALALTIGSNVTSDGFEEGSKIRSSWRAPLHRERVRPFAGQ
jgi:hypothetical protein